MRDISSSVSFGHGKEDDNTSVQFSKQSKLHFDLHVPYENLAAMSINLAA
jgi:hypothetical protein